MLGLKKARQNIFNSNFSERYILAEHFDFEQCVRVLDNVY